jgi:hypothetical protein
MKEVAELPLTETERHTFPNKDTLLGSVIGHGIMAGKILAKLPLFTK